jgi:hypothetical protein
MKEEDIKVGDIVKIKSKTVPNFERDKIIPFEGVIQEIKTYSHLSMYYGEEKNKLLFIINCSFYCFEDFEKKSQQLFLFEDD